MNLATERFGLGYYLNCKDTVIALLLTFHPWCLHTDLRIAVSFPRFSTYNYTTAISGILTGVIKTTHWPNFSIFYVPNHAPQRV